MDDQATGFNLSFNGFDHKARSVTLKCNQTMFVVGPNGAGKSALAQFITSQNFSNSHWVAAHRQVWFTSDSSDITASNRDQLDKQFQSQTRSPESRYKDQSAHQRSQAAVFDLVNSDNDYNRQVVDKLKAGENELAELLLAKQAPVDRLNRILRNSNLEVQIFIDNGRRLLAKKKTSNRTARRLFLTENGMPCLSSHTS